MGCGPKTHMYISQNDPKQHDWAYNPTCGKLPPFTFIINYFTRTWGGRLTLMLDQRPPSHFATLP